MKYQGETMKTPKETDLPGFRVNYMPSAFSTTGLDYAGPLFVRYKGLPSSKVYILLFTCASSRAIHLELNPDMKTPAFLRGFVSRKRKPNEIINDNFKTFKSTEVKSFMSNAEVHQRFILPASPWWGRILQTTHEVCEELTKEDLEESLGHLWRVANDSVRDWKCDQLSTSMLNTSNEDLDATITPNHLMFGRNLNVPTTKPFTDDMNPSDECTKRINHLKSLVSHFWKRFSST